VKGNNQGIGYNVIIEVLQEFQTKNEAMQAEFDLINEKYGIYPLINTFVGNNSYASTIDCLERRTVAVSKARSKPAVELNTGIEYSSLLSMSEQLNVPYERLQKRVSRIRTMLDSGHDFIYIKDYFQFKDNVYPARI
jgi:hypothetical protein